MLAAQREQAEAADAQAEDAVREGEESLRAYDGEGRLELLYGSSSVSQ